MNDGTSRLARLAWPAQGGVATNQQGPGREGQSHIETLLAPGDWLLTRLQDGKQYNTIHKFISKDGKTMYQTNKSVDTQGQYREYILVFDRQSNNAFSHCIFLSWLKSLCHFCFCDILLDIFGDIYGQTANDSGRG